MRLDDPLRPIREQICSAANADDLRSCLGELLAPEERSRLDSALARLASDEVVIAVIGRQGIGKSSLVNAIIGRRVLPVDELETTNVICRVRAAQGGEEGVEVRFHDGRVERAPLDEAWLSQFVNQQENPDNAKGVAEVVARVESDVLGPGLALADTPGVGAGPTTARVTRDFLPQVCVGIFMVGTSPTLLSSEVQFLRSTWEHSRSFVYVQNLWAASDREAQDAVADNRRKLQQLSTEAGMPASPTVLAVDVHGALEGVSNDRPDLVETSGLSLLRAELREMMARGTAVFLTATGGRQIVTVLDAADRAARDRTAALQAAGRTSREQSDAALAAVEAELESIRGTWNEDARSFEEGMKAISECVGPEVAAAVGKAEQELAALIKGRRVDSKRIAEAVPETLSLQLTGVARRVGLRMEQETRRFIEKTDEALTSVSGATGGRGGQGKDPGVGAAEGFETGGRLVSGVAGFALSTMVGAAVWAGGAALLAGEGLAGAAAAAGAAVPGVGWAVAVVVLAAGWGLRTYAASRVVHKMLRSLADTCSTAAHDATVQLRRAVDGRKDTVVAILQARLQTSLAQQRRTMAAIQEDFDRSADDRARTLVTLSAWLGTLSEARARIEALLAGLEVAR